MLEQLRRSARSGFSYILVGALIVVFAVFFGAPPEGCRAAGGRVLMANVAGNTIHSDEVNIVYNRVWGNQRSTDEDQFYAQQALALRSVMLIHLLAEKAQKAGLRVSDEEFQQYILDPNRNIEYRFVYGRDGSFDGPLYKAYVQNQLRVALPKYEDFKRKELLARKYMAMVDMQVSVTPQELEERHELRNTEVNLEFVKLSADDLKDAISITDEEVEAFLAENKKEVEEKYEANRAQYEEPAQVLVRRIFIVKPDEEEERKAAQVRFETAKSRVLEQNEDFADVAGEMTEDYAKERQGLMDWSTLENLDQNIAAAIKDAKVGEVKEVDTDFAYMLVKLEERKEAKRTPLEEVQNDIARNLLQERKVDTIVASLADALKKQAEGAESLEAALTSLKEQTGGQAEEGEQAGDEAESALPWEALEVKQTGFFSLEGQDMSALFGGQFAGMRLGRAAWDRVPEIGKSAELAADAFDLTADKPMAEKVYNVDDARVIVRLKERKEPKPFAELSEEERLELAADARNEKATELLGNWSSLFVVPGEDYGPWVEDVYQQALESGAIRLFDANSPAVPLVRKKDQAPAPSIMLDTEEAS